MPDNSHTLKKKPLKYMVRQVSLETAEKTNSRIRLSKTRNITMIIFKKVNMFTITLIGKKRGIVV